MLELILATLVTLGLLITFHEFGHFWVARKCGVEVLRFSVGFGKPLWRKVDKQGTEFVVAAIPLGGYVKMLDEREGDVPHHKLDKTFNRKPVLSRIAIVAAGPIANFLLAIVIYALTFGIGTTSVKPIVGEVQSQSIAEQAGLRSGMLITEIDGKAVQSWMQVQLALVRRIGESGEIKVMAGQDASWQESYSVNIDRWQEGVRDPDPFSALGIKPYMIEVPAAVGEIVAESAASQSGLQKDDLIVSIDGESVQDWTALVEKIQSSAGVSLDLEVNRAGEQLQLTLVPDSKELDDGRIVGFMGAAHPPVSWPDEYLVNIQYGVFESLWKGVEKTWDMSVLTLESIGKMISGLISVDNISGPITIAKVAGNTVNMGLVPFLSFLAYVSVSLGVLNLLPIPVLDGGHLVYYLIELARGKPLSQNVQDLGLRMGVAMMATLMIFAVYNDITRWFIGS